MPGALFCSISGKGAVAWCATGLQVYRGQGRGPVRPQDSQAIFGRRLTSKEGRQARGRVFPGEAGRGPRERSDATPAAPRAGGTVPPQEERRVAPGRSDRRSREQRVCPSPAFPLGAGRGGGRGGAKPQGVRLRAAEINSGYWRGVTDRRGAGGGAGGSSHEGRGRRSVCVLGGRPEVWGRLSSSSAGSYQRLQAALSPPPGAFSPVRSRARAARGEGRRRREQPVV